MIIEAKDTETGKTVGVAHCCNGCGDVSDVRRKQELPKGWTAKTELFFNEKGLHTRKSGFVVNYYCRLCTTYGATAYTVAMTTRKLTRPRKVIHVPKQPRMQKVNRKN